MAERIEEAALAVHSPRHLVIADLGVSSMQLDNPDRGFNYKEPGPLDMRMNPTRGESASRLLERVSQSELVTMLTENADEPHADLGQRASRGYAPGPGRSQHVRHLHPDADPQVETVEDRGGRDSRRVQEDPLYFTQLDASRMPPDQLADAARALGMRVENAASVEAALRSLARLAYEVPPRILITGSLYLAGHVLAANGTPPG